MMHGQTQIKLQGSTKLDKGSVKYEHLQCSLKRFWVTRSHESKEGSRGVWVPVSYELTRVFN